MTKLKQVYKCNVCGNIVEMLHTGVGELVCCGEPMHLQKENTVDASLEKHVPVLEILPANDCKESDGVKILIGSDPHPMTEEHFIEWIEINLEDGRSGKVFLNPGDKPEAEFHARGKVIGARAYCNLHGLWKS
ncbi:desulfoferrodoxin [Patescibacteria group bacterium]|nr:desulfoferrodoxin [Patescibacteria group bacterium]